MCKLVSGLLINKCQLFSGRVTVCPLLVITAVLCNFLRVNAQIHNLDKQKTTQGRKTL